MKVAIQRHGIVIRSVELTGDRARIGNTPDCEVLIDDAYLSPHVADFVRVNGVWHIVDAGRLEGVQRDGVRIEDEAVLDGATYSVGGFELVPHLDRARADVSSAPSAVRPASLPTIVEPREVPKTIYEAAPAPQPVYVPPPQPVEAEPPPAKSSRRGRILVLSVALFLGFLLVLLALMKPAKKPVAATTTVTAAPVQPQPQQPASAGDEVKAGERALAALDYDAGLRHWEAALKLSPDPALQRRYADVAVDVGRAFLARGDSEKGRAYLKKAIELGPANAESVQVAKRLTR